MSDSDRFAVAGRLRHALAHVLHDVPTLARDLAVDEMSLRMSVDEKSPYPTLDVIAAVVKRYAIDPAYILTGRYDSAMHRSALSGDMYEIAEVVRKLAQMS